jgi:hypothetical protein
MKTRRSAARFPRRWQIAIVLAALARTAVAGEAAPPATVRLVDAGRPLAAIVVPDAAAEVARRGVTRWNTPTAATALAALELADYVAKATGARLPIVGESGPPVDLPARIHLGAVRANIARFAPRPPAPEEFILQTAPDALHVCGGDTAPGDLACLGTLYGVYALLEEQLGVRWLFPGEAGEVVPRRATLDLPALDRREQPRVAKRRIRNVAVSREETYAPVLREWGVTVEDWKRAHGPEATGAWFRRQRLGQRIEIAGGHSYAGWWEQYGTSHPEIFSQQPDGTRRQTPPREQFCVSNPVLWDLVAQRRIEEFAADPTQRTLSISPNDGGRNTFCLCDRCRAWDPPHAPKVANHAMLVDPVTRRPYPEYPSLSDRYFRYFNEVARRVRAALPDRYLVCYAYSAYRTPPVAIDRLEPNLIVGYVGLATEDIAAWSRLAAQLYIRPNDLGPAIDLGLPRNLAPWLAHAVKFAVDRRALAFDFDNCHGNWGGHGLDYYVLARALWNPDLDVAATVADYCRAAYGPAADPMRRYFARLVPIGDGLRGDKALTARGSQPWRILDHYTPAALDELGRLLDSARAACGPADTAARTRVELAADALHHARLVTALLATVRRGDKTSPAYRQQLDQVVQHLQQKLLTPAVASLHTHRYLRIALSYATREEE